MAVIQNEYFDIVHDNLMSWLGNEVSVCAFMGNFYAESKITPNRRQGDNAIPIGQSSLKYTADVDDGTRTEYRFVHDSIGYGLAQWTYYSRKQHLYDIEPLSTSSIGNVYRQLKLVKAEIYGNKTAMDFLLGATDLHATSDWICKNYERPAVNNYATRRAYTDEIYELYNGTPSHKKYVSINVIGNGTATAIPSSGVEGTSVQLKADPKDDSSFEKWEILSGIETLELPEIVAYNELIIGTENVMLNCYFTGETPVPPPIPIYVKHVEEIRKHMPIWFYRFFDWI